MTQTKPRSSFIDFLYSDYGPFSIFALALILLGCMQDSPMHLLHGFYLILVSPSQLFTDYLALAGMGPTLINVGLLLAMSLALMKWRKVPLNGPGIGALGMLAGFSFFGKNLFNSLPIMLGVWIYTKATGQYYRNYMIVSLFGTTLGPLVSFLAFGSGLPLLWSLPLSILAGLIVGFCLPSLATQFLGFHQGFSLYNIGFTAGIVGMVATALMKGFNIEVPTQNLLSQEDHLFLVRLILCLILATLSYGYYLSVKYKQELKFQELWSLSGRLPSDFVEMTNRATALMNIGIMGAILLSYVTLYRIPLNGPIIGGLIGVMSFGAFGNHPKNTIPVLLGISLGAWLTKVDPTSTSVIIAALFGTTLAPIAGYYGPLAGLVAGFLHISLVGHVVYLHSGLNLYNNGFAGGFVAAALVPIVELHGQIKSRWRRKSK